MDDNLYVGQRINYIGNKGTIRYSGSLKHQPKNSKVDIKSHWLGVEWDDSGRGNHNGTVDGIFYFNCEWSDSQYAASLIKFQKTHFGVSALEAFVIKYFKPEEAQSLLKNSDELFEQLKEIKSAPQIENQKQLGMQLEYDAEAIIKTSISYKKIEFLGFQNIWKRMKDLSSLQNLSLSGYSISHFGQPGHFGTIFTSLKELSLEDNLISSWDQIEALAVELPNLETLWLSKNRLQLPTNATTSNLEKEVERPSFQKVTTIILSEMNLTWKHISKIKYLFPAVRELGLAHNKLNDFGNLDLTLNDFPYLAKLDLSHNNVSDCHGLCKLQCLNLKKMNLHGNLLTNIAIGPFFPLLTHLNASKNKIDSLNILSQLSQYKSLESLRIVDNPFLAFQDKVHCRLLIIGSVKNIKTLNGSELKKDEKKDGEIYYLKNAFHEFFKASNTTAFTYCLDSFNQWAKPIYPRIEELIKKFGNPYPVEERFYEEPIRPNKINFDERPIKPDRFGQQVGSNFCLVTFWKIVDGKEVRVALKKLPKNIDIGYMKTFLKNTLKLQNKVQSLALITSHGSIELDNDLKKLSDYVSGNIDAKIMASL